MAAVWVSSLGGIFIGEEGSEQCGTDGDTFSHLSALQWGVFLVFFPPVGSFSSSQWGFVFSFSVGSIFFSVSGSFFSVGIFFLVAGSFSQWGVFFFFVCGSFFSVGSRVGGGCSCHRSKEGPSSLSALCCSTTLIYCVVNISICESALTFFWKKKNEMVKKNKRIQMPTCN